MNGKFNINIDKLRSDMYEAGKEDKEMFYPTDPLKQFPDRTPSELRSAASDALKKTQERYTNSYGIRITMSDCPSYEEDQFICDDVGEPKGQCAHCGYKWYEHTLDALPECERESAKSIQEG